MAGGKSGREGRGRRSRGGPLLDVVDCCGGEAESFGDAHAARSEPMAMTMETEMTALRGGVEA